VLAAHPTWALPVIVRDATPADGAACAAIYAPYVDETAISFELEPPTPEEMADRIAAAQDQHAWLVLEEDGRLLGYAYANRFSARPAYRWSVEVSIYLLRGRHRAGGGRRLYQALLQRLVERGYRRAMAGMTLPNDASVAFHRALGFTAVGVYRKVGWKHGAWHDVAWVQRTIADGDDPPAEPGRA
jgi:L-amino acid N-acyltransferase YncA